MRRSKQMKKTLIIISLLATFCIASEPVAVVVAVPFGLAALLIQVAEEGRR